ncbi:MAG: hypothetical protein P4L36_04795 [Holophaga sp.]|nr:hypothetical protein [Holophaga sp.]
MPHTLVLLAIFILLAGVLTHVVPAGEFTRFKDAAGRLIIVPGTFHLVAARPVAFFAVPAELIKGLLKASHVVYYVIIIGGTSEIVTRTGMIRAFTGRMAQALQGREAWVIPIFMGVFAVAGFTMGMSSEVLIFIPIGIIAARSVGFDTVTGTAMILLGTHLGFIAGLFNPFTTGIAQAIAQVPIFSGLWLRVVVLVVFLVVTSLYTARYACRVKADPARSVVADLPELNEPDDKDAMVALKAKHFVVLAIIVVGLTGLLYGATTKKWLFDEMAALFLSMGIVSGFAAGFNPNQVARYFMDGSRRILYGALIIGFSGAIIVVLEDGKVVDSIIYYLVNCLNYLPIFMRPLGMYAVNLLISPVILSASGMAMATIPVMAPVADLLHISRQTAVLIFQFGNDITHLVLPTTAATMGALAAAKIPYERWLKWVWPLFLAWIVMGGLFILFAVAIGYK